MDEREKDIQELCKAVLENYEQDGGDHRDYCRFCGSNKYGKDIEHKTWCAVLIAKDLTAGISSMEARK